VTSTCFKVNLLSFQWRLFLLLLCAACFSHFDFGESESVLCGARYGFRCWVLISRVSCFLFCWTQIWFAAKSADFRATGSHCLCFPSFVCRPQIRFSIPRFKRIDQIPRSNFISWLHVSARGFSFQFPTVGFLDPSGLWCCARESFSCSVLVSSARKGENGK
jgi:hypothetical protein